MGWDKPYLPKRYRFEYPQGKHNLERVYLAGEIPDKILNEKDPQRQRELSIQWGLLMLELRHGFKDPAKHFELDVSPKTNPRSQAKNKLKITVFPLELNDDRSGTKT